jgi:hypothetical protein
MTEKSHTKLQRLYILLTRPFVMAAYRLRERRRFNKNVPLIWRTPREITHLDLEYYEPEDENFTLDKKFVDDLQPARDAVRTSSNRIALINIAVFAFLLSDYLSIGMNFSIPGVSIVDKKGVREFLLFFISVSGPYGLMIQNNMYTLESAMKFAISKFPKELQGIYIAKYFYLENFTPLFPTQLPHINATGLHTRIAMLISVLLLILIIVYSTIYISLYVAIAIDVWKEGRLGTWSYFIASASIANATVGVGYLIFTRLKMPYRDYSVLHELQGLREVAPSQYERRNWEVYGEGVEDYQDLVARGYIKRKGE